MNAKDDERERARALDPTRSFIVEAPAGSGKTELLIQRFLRLLTRVERPEQIIAITFTRKAAAEMRQRVIETLNAAAEGSAPLPKHRQDSVELARRVHAWARDRGWQLPDQPGRLRITTIDALNQRIAQQMPLSAGGAGTLAVSDDAGRQYQLAARRTTESLGEPGPLGESLQLLLIAADNSLARLEGWLSDLLPQRDRWLRGLAGAGAAMESLGEYQIEILEQIARDRLAAVRRLVSETHQESLFRLLGQVRGSTPGSGKAPEGTATSDLAQWREAARLLLRQDGEWRLRFTRRDGFPPEAKSERQALDALVRVFRATDGLAPALAAFAAVPPAPSNGAQAQFLDALEHVFPRLLAELRIIFEKEGCSDHTEQALAAEHALGAADMPSELLLALDRRIEHILVDEFQDTSHLQWRLLRLLTSGWTAGDGRTLFLVGDPMQSIYGFRDADLTLFLEARARGLGGVPLEPLRLSQNFRSSSTIVDWVDARFASIFPDSESPDLAEPAYRPSLPSQASGSDSCVELHLFSGDDYSEETRRVIEIVAETRTLHPNGSVGILVRSRTHLLGLRGALDQAGLRAQAVEIDSLTDTQLGQDLIGLTSALLHPADRLSWLGVLRSPWCGLDWSDLFALASADPSRSIPELLDDEACRARLSAAGRRRAAWLAGRLDFAYSLRATRNLASWLRQCWLMIDGPAAAADMNELELAERYFAELDRLARHGDLDDPAMLRDHFVNPLASSRTPVECGIEIMTIHRAKGLEFDTVILPGLSRTVRGNIRNIFFYRDFNTSIGQRLRLLAAANEDSIADFLQQSARRHEAAERGRLLYVAVTRAKRRLHLLGTIDSGSGKPRGGSLLATLWPSLESAPEVSASYSRDEPADEAFIELPLRRLSFTGAPTFLPETDLGLADDAFRPEFEWVSPASVQVGTLIHRELDVLARAAIERGASVPPEIDQQRYRRELALLGVEPDDLGVAADRVAEALGSIWADPVGRWILKPWPEGWSELRLTLRAHNRLEHIQLDRSFVDERGQRWIIDYKTGRHLGGDVEAFLENEVERYRSQLEQYAAAVAEIDSRPIRVGLYFPLMKRLREVSITPMAMN